MTNAKISYKHNIMHHIRKNYALKYVSNDKNKCINGMLQVS